MLTNRNYEKSEKKRNEYMAKVKRVPRTKGAYNDERGVNGYLQGDFAGTP